MLLREPGKEGAMTFRFKWFARMVATGAVLTYTTITLCETPVPELGECGGVGSTNPKLELPFPQPRAFRVGSSGLCSTYSSFGWEKPVNLYLGEGAQEYLPKIRQAVDLWNQALIGFNREPIIRIVTNQMPTSYTLDSDFWENREVVAKSLVRDGESVIYFKASGPRSGLAGYAYRRWDPTANVMVEADTYINTYALEKYRGPIYRTQEVYRVDEDSAIFARVDRLFLTVLHEIGHMLGLKHVPVSGNIMSYNYMPRMAEIWAPVIALTDRFSPIQERDWGMISDPSKMRGSYTLDINTERGRYLDPLIEMYTKSATLGEQDKQALMCVYDFSDWNH